MEKKVFKIKRVCKATYTIDVVAESLEEAKRKAAQRFDCVPHGDYMLYDCDDAIESEAVVTDDVDELTDMAIAYIREEVDHDGDAVSFKSVKYHYVSLDCDESGRCIGEVEHTLYVDSAYVSEDGYLWLQPEECEYEDFELTELAEDEQIKVLKAILGIR